ncbi:branched-chain amino acid ABC transporter permease [uncultured Methylobacterium sp.]|jgi:branched-chain amino acid transport system permease protein|uniref:branched-chain amino acid ABC transporter permease n=1 Tax=uncultured Methylobacterium sp. TaxID=157278 RepID=UPI002613939B|nr:branched-chain amino acid ABC transporter permease [uncultured Methylobacterium sp.]
MTILGPRRVHPAEILPWLAVAALPWVAPDHVLLGSQIAILALFALSLDLLVGHAGLVSLGHAAFFGLGAYAAALLALHGWSEPLTGLAAGGLVAGLAAALVAPLVVRVHGLAQLMVTLGLGLMLHEAASRARFLTGGDDGLSGFEPSPVLGLFPFDLYGFTAYGYALAVLAAGFLFYTRLAASPFGYALRGLKQNPARMAALGTDGRRRLIQGFVVAAVLAGIAGALLAQTTQSVALESLSFHRSAEVLIVLCLGGTGGRYGGLVGALAYMAARDWLSALSPHYWTGWIGAAMMLTVLLVPGGLGGVARRLQGRLPRLNRAAGARIAAGGEP